MSCYPNFLLLIIHKKQLIQSTSCIQRNPVVSYDEEPLIQDDIDTLMEEAEDFYETELDNQEEVYDEEEEN